MDRKREEYDKWLLTRVKSILKISENFAFQLFNYLTVSIAFSVKKQNFTAQ